MDQQWLIQKSNKRPKLKCKDDFSKIISLNKNSISQIEAEKLLNYIILYVIVDSRTVISEELINQLKSSGYLINMLRADWLNVSGLIKIVRKVIQLRQPDFGGYFGNYRMTNAMFLNLLRERMSLKAQKRLGILGHGNRKLIRELRSIYRFSISKGRFFKYNLF